MYNTEQVPSLFYLPRIKFDDVPLLEFIYTLYLHVFTLFILYLLEVYPETFGDGNNEVRVCVFGGIYIPFYYYYFYCSLVFILFILYLLMVHPEIFGSRNNEVRRCVFGGV